MSNEKISDKMFVKEFQIFYMNSPVEIRLLLRHMICDYFGDNRGDKIMDKMFIEGSKRKEHKNE